MFSSATATRCSVLTSSTIVATRRWGAFGAISTSRRSAVKRLGRTRQRVILRLRRTNGGTGMTTTTPSPRLIRSGLTSQPTLKEPPSEGARRKRQKRVKEGRGDPTQARFGLRGAVRRPDRVCLLLV